MALITPTVEVMGDEALTNSIIDRSITELQDNLITSLGLGALRECKALKKAVFSAVTTVGQGAFALCTGLTVVDLWAATRLDSESFSGCTALSALIIRTETVCSMQAYNALYNTSIADGTGYIYVPAALVDSYKTATNWSTYANQIRAIEEWPEVCDPYSWETVAKTIENGTYKDVYKIGDTVPVDLGSEGVINMQIAAFDADTLADGSGTAAITWIAKELLATSKTMGNATTGGWESSPVRAYLKDTIKPIIPAVAQSAIVEVTKTQVLYVTSQSDVQITNDDVWIPSRKEVSQFGTVIYSELFPDGAARVKRKTGGTSAQTWWLRDVITSNEYVAIGTSGSNTTVRCYNSSCVCLGFCTGKSK